MLLTLFSRNCILRIGCASRDLHCPRREIQLSRGRYGNISEIPLFKR